MSVDKVAKLQEIKNKEKIFMIEVVIQKVFLDVIELNDFAFRNAETCISYKFLDVGPFKICEKDFKSMNAEKGGCVGCGLLKNGNSTMFPLFPDQINDIKTKGFQLDIEVVKLFKPIPKTVGTTEVPMKFIFEAVMETMLKKSVDTASKSMRNRYKLKDEEGDPVGYVDFFIRFSSMGKIIVTKFQMDTARECMEFQSNTGTSYKYQKKAFPDPFICRPCGKPTIGFPPHERIPIIPQSFPAFKITDEMKKRLQERRYKELGIEPPPPPPERKSKLKNGKGNAPVVPAPNSKPGEEKAAPSPAPVPAPAPPPAPEEIPAEQEGGEQPPPEEQ